MFDPFGDFESAGYLRNTQSLKDENLVKRIEHEVFRANLTDAIAFLSKRKTIVYDDFLSVHRILFSDFYPWAGQDRLKTAPTIAVSKASVLFCHPIDAIRAVSEGLRIAQHGAMRRALGEVMGLFAYGHPFLDGNGRTMLIVHAELCYRAGFSVNWAETTKSDYLNALSREIASPKDQALNEYLSRFIGPKVPRARWFESMAAIGGLDGAGVRISDAVDGDFRDDAVLERYRNHVAQRRCAAGSPAASDGDGPHR